MAKYAGIGKEFKLVKGKSAGGVDIAIIEYAQRCDPSTCPIGADCAAIGGDKCQLHKDFLRHIIKMVYKYEEDGLLSPHALHTAGILIIPLYTHLFKFYLVEMGSSSPVMYGKSVYIHPIYREIRNTIKTIQDMWASIGLSKNLAPLPTIPTGGYYELISGGSVAEEGGVVASTNKVNIQDVPVTADEVADTDPADTDYAPVVRRIRGENQKVMAGATGTAAERLQVMQQLSAELELNPEMELGFEIEDIPLNIPAGFDPTIIPDTAEQQTFIKARLRVRDNE